MLSSLFLVICGGYLVYTVWMHYEEFAFFQYVLVVFQVVWIIDTVGGFPYYHWFQTKWDTTFVFGTVKMGVVPAYLTLLFATLAYTYCVFESPIWKWRRPRAKVYHHSTSS